MGMRFAKRSEQAVIIPNAPPQPQPQPQQPDSDFLQQRIFENGLARTPPMGWASWERFECRTDCARSPESCLGERLVLKMMDALVSGGYKDAGYTFVNVDDCWSAESRDDSGELVPDPARFPSGMRALADAAHKRGLRFGLYTSIGAKTCVGLPGTANHFRRDSQRFASWGVDLLKVDGCNANESHFGTLFPQLGRELNSTGRPILYSCSWPAYLQDAVDLREVARWCNTWRATWDIHDSYPRMLNVVNWWIAHQNVLSVAQKPGSFADPDWLLVGNFGLSDEQSRMQMSLWALFSAPLFLSNDLRSISASQREIILNTEVIAVDQDPLGALGKLTRAADNLQWWKKPLADGSFAVVVVNLWDFGEIRRVSTRFAQDLDIATTGGFVRDLWNHRDLGLKRGAFVGMIAPTGAGMYRIYPRNVECKTSKLASRGDHIVLTNLRPEFERNQNWKFSRGGKIRLASNSTLCIAATNEADADSGDLAVWLEQCTDASHGYDFDPETHTLRNTLNRLCLALSSSATQDHAGVVETACTMPPHNTQQWAIEGGSAVASMLFPEKVLTVCPVALQQ